MGNNMVARPSKFVSKLLLVLFLCYSFTFLGQSDVVGAASFTCSTLAENFGKVICGTHELLLRVGSG